MASRDGRGEKGAFRAQLNIKATLAPSNSHARQQRRLRWEARMYIGERAPKELHCAATAAQLQPHSATQAETHHAHAHGSAPTQLAAILPLPSGRSRGALSLLQGSRAAGRALCALLSQGLLGGATPTRRTAAHSQCDAGRILPPRHCGAEGAHTRRPAWDQGVADGPHVLQACQSPLRSARCSAAPLSVASWAVQGCGR